MNSHTPSESFGIIIRDKGTIQHTKGTRLNNKKE